MSKIRKEAIRAIETLDSSELLMVYDMILSLKRTRAFEKSKEKNTQPYKEVRDALRSCKGDLSSDIIKLREDRL
jgi:hypothetical protein